MVPLPVHAVWQAGGVWQSALCLILTDAELLPTRWLSLVGEVCKQHWVTPLRPMSWEHCHTDVLERTQLIGSAAGEGKGIKITVLK